MTYLRLLKGELKKTAKPRSLLILAIILVVFFLLMIFVFSLFQSIGAEAGDAAIDQIGSQKFDVSVIETKEIAEAMLAEYREDLKSLEARRDEIPKKYYSSLDEIYQTKSMIAAIEFVMDHNLYGQKIDFYFGDAGSILGAADGNPSGFDFTEFASSSLLLIITLYLITVGAGILSNELKTGSIKLLMLRPVTRNEVTSAKLSATAIYGVTLYSLAFLLAFAYGAIRYGAARTPVLYVFNATSAFLADRGFSLILTWLSGVLTMLSFTLLAYTAGTLFKSAAAGIGLGAVSAFGLIGILFNMFGGGRFLLSYQGNLTDYFSLSNMSLYGGSDFFLMIGMLAVWWIIMLAVSYLVFDKRDVV